MFADTSGWASLADRNQSFHALAASLVRHVSQTNQAVVTTSYVLIELTALLISPLRIARQQQIQRRRRSCGPWRSIIVQPDNVKS